MRVAAHPNRTRLIVEKAGRRKEMLEMLKKILSTSSARIPFTSSTGEELRIPKMILNRSDAGWSCFFMGKTFKKFKFNSFNYLLLTIS